MTIDEFWQLIDRTREESKGDTEQQAALLIQMLVEMDEDEIISYQHIYDDLKAQAYRDDLWDVAYIISEGCGDDGFTDFRAWLIGQGQSVFERALSDPETLADVVTLRNRYDTRAEKLGYVAMKAYWEKLDNNNTMIPSNGVSFEHIDTSRCNEKDSMQFNSRDDCLKQRYPIVWEKFGW